MSDNDQARNRDLTAQQELALRVLLATGDDTAAAAEAGCSPRTLRRWRASELFAAALRGEARLAAREATSSLLAAQGEAVAALRAALRAPSVATRVRAARALLEVGLRATDDDTEQRPIELERRSEQWTNEQRYGLRVLNS